MSKASYPYENWSMERFYNTFISNFYNITSFSSTEMMDEVTMKYINWYNYVRLNSHNNYLILCKNLTVRYLSNEALQKFLTTKICI